MTIKELVKDVRLELNEALSLDKAEHKTTSRACLYHAQREIAKYLRPFERYVGKTRS